jgi:hypothetical protein
MCGLALVNVFLPLAILRLAARRRPWTTRVLLALPVAAAIPLTAFIMLEPSLPVQFAALAHSPKAQYVVGTLMGIPFLVYAARIVVNILRRRWRRLLVFIALTLLAAAAVAACWVSFDMRTMPAIEHYDWSAWWHGNSAPSINLAQLVQITG